MPNNKKLSPDQLESAQAIVKKNSTNVPVDQCFIENNPTAVGQVLAVSGLNTGSHSLEWIANTISGAAGGSLGGTYPNPEVVKLNETGGPTALTIGAIPANTVLTRDGAGNIVGVASVPPGAHTHAAADVTSGQLAVARGGSNADLSGTGGPGQVVRQPILGGAFTVSTITPADLPVHTHVRLDVTDLDDTAYYVGAGPHTVSPPKNLHHIDTTVVSVANVDAAWQSTFDGGGVFTIFNTGTNSLTINPPLGWTIDNGMVSLAVPAGKSVQLHFPNAGTPDIRVSGGTHVLGAGEVNTASNVNVGGVGVFKAKVGFNLEFRGVNAASSKISVALDVPNNEIDVDVVEASLTLGSIGGTLPISKGGTGQTTQTAAFNALDPLTTKGDLIVHDGTDSVREPVGTNGQVLTADSAQSSGVKWATPAGGGGDNVLANGVAVTDADFRSTTPAAPGTNQNNVVQSVGASPTGITTYTPDATAGLKGVIRLGGDLGGAGTADVPIIANGAVTLVKIQSATANSKLLGSGSAGIGLPYSEVTVGAGLTMTGTTLSAGGGGATPQIIPLSPLPFTTASAAYTLVSELILDGSKVTGVPTVVYAHISTNPGTISLDVFDATSLVSLGSLLVTPLTGIVSWPIVAWVGAARIQFLVRKNSGGGSLTVSPVTLHAG